MSKKQQKFKKTIENINSTLLLIALIGLALLYAEVASAIQITEIMYNPKGKDTTEFIEFYNETAARRDISGWKFTTGIDFVFPEGAIVEPRSYFILARNVKIFKDQYNFSNEKKTKLSSLLSRFRDKKTVQIFGPFKKALSNKSDHLVLVDLAGGVMVDVDYDSRGRWSIAPDGTGHSLSKIRPRLDPNLPENWRASLQMGGTPGKDNGFATQTVRSDELAQQPTSIVVNEIFASKNELFIELYNCSSKPFDLGGYWISNDPSNLKIYQLPDELIIDPHGYKILSQSQTKKRANPVNLRYKNELGFEFNTKKDRVFITIPDGTQVVEACAFEIKFVTQTVSLRNVAKMSSGRYPDGSDEWYVMPQSPDETNTVDLNPNVVFNEIMYHPASSANDEYVELYNRGDEPVDLSEWSISDGISFKFSRGTIIAPDSFLIIAKAREHLIDKYGLDSDRVLGDYKRSLSNNGEMIKLRDELGNKVDEVRYYDGGHWPKFADGYSSSLELIDPDQDNGNYQAWKPSNETQKAEWTYVNYSGTWNGDEMGDEQSVEFHFHLLGAGEVLIDDIRLTSPKTPLFARLTRRSGEQIENGSFERGLKGWVILGNHVETHTVGSAPQHGRKCLKVVASGSGNTAPNHIEIPLQSPLKSGETYTISFWTKWQWGSNLLATRCLGNQLPETHSIPIPKLTGTPGKRNSVYKPNLGPIVSDVRHSPVIPTHHDVVHVTARVYDPDGIGSVTLYHKADHSTGTVGLPYNSTEMHDDGKHADGQPHDGIYGGIIPPNHPDQTVAFQIKAKDKKEQSNTWPRDLGSPALYRIEEKPMKSELPTYRIIMTAEDSRELTQRISLGNEPLNATFVFNERDVYYNVTCRYTGSPYRRGRGGFSGYKIRFNVDEKLHGVKRQARFDRNDNSPEGYYNERVAYDLLRKIGVPTCEQEWIHVKFNSDESEQVWEHILPPSKRYLETFYPDDPDGQLFEVFEQFTFYGSPQESNFNARGSRFEWLGTDDKDRYRWFFLPRNHEQEDDFSNVIQLVKVMNTTPDEQYESAIDEVIDVSEWLKVMAVRSIVSDWDFLGTNMAKNAYIYRPNKTGKWDLLSWDNEWGFERADMSIWSDSPTIRRFQESPNHQHLYLSYLQELIDKYFNVDNLEPWFKHYHSVVKGVSPDQMTSFVKDRTAYLDRVIPKAVAKIIACRRTDPGMIELEGSAPVQVRSVRIAGKEHELDWIDATHWKLTIADVDQENLTLEFRDYDDKVIGEDSSRVK